MNVGVIAVQGDVREHAAAIERAAAAHGIDSEVRTVRTRGVVPDCDVLLMPGGESTTISRLLAEEGIDDEIRAHVEAGKRVLATCAGLIVAARDPKDNRVRSLDVLDVSVDRNAFGRQTESFEAPLDVAGLAEPFPAVFIRAPLIDAVGDGVEVLAEWEGTPVAVRQGPVVATAFHPELTPDTRLHELALFDDAGSDDAIETEADDTGLNPVDDAETDDTGPNAVDDAEGDLDGSTPARPTEGVR